MIVSQRNCRIAMGLGLAVAVVVLLWLVFGGRRYVDTDNAYIKIDTASLTANVSGQLVAVYVERNQAVAKGQVLAEIDPQPYRIALDQATADLHTMRNDILSERANYGKLVAQRDQAQQDVAYYRRELERLQGMDKVAVARSKLDTGTWKLGNAQAQVRMLDEQLASLRAKLGGGPEVPVEKNPDFQAAQARLDQARYDLAHTRIMAPYAGIIGGSTPMVGERVQPGLPVFKLTRTGAVWVQANIKETNLTDVRPGQTAEVKVDSYPGVTWSARVESLSPATGSEFALIPAQNASGNWVKVVQRIPVRLQLLDTDGKPPLRAGMSSEVSIDTGASLFGGDVSKTADAAH